MDIGKPLIAKLDLHRPTRRNSCQQTCLMPHSPSTSPSPSPSPGAERLLLHGNPCHHMQSSSPFLHVCEPYGVSLHHDDAYCYENNSPYTNLPSVPIETTEDIEDMQNRFMDSLHLYNQPWTAETGTKTWKEYIYLHPRLCDIVKCQLLYINCDIFCYSEFSVLWYILKNIQIW